MELSGKTNALKFVKRGGSHRTRIADFPKEAQHQILTTLKEWIQ